MPTLLTVLVSKCAYLYTHEYTLQRVQPHRKHTKTDTKSPPCLSHPPDSFSLSSSLPDTNPGQKIPFKSTVCRLCFTGRLCYCVITHKHSLPPSLFPSLSPATPPPPSLLPRSSAVGAEPLIKSLRQKLLSSEYQVSAFRQEQHWQERGRVGEGEARMTRKPAAVRGEEAGVPSDSHDCYCCIEKMVVV